MSARSLAIKGRTQSPRDINSRPAPKTATVAPKVIGGTPCLGQLRIRVQILPLKHVASRQLPDGMSELLGLMAGGTIFRASPRSRKRSAGLKKRRRRGCGTQHSVRALFSRSRHRIEPAIRIQMTPGAVANELGIARRVQHDAEAAIPSIAVAAAPRSAIRGRTVPGATRSRWPTNRGQKMKA